MKRRLLILGLALVGAGGGLYLVWSVADWPPPLLLLEYGPPPAGGPTGETRTIEGIEFVELEPGYFRMGSHRLCHEGSTFGKICRYLGLPWGDQPRHRRVECPVRWAEIPTRFWIARTEVPNSVWERFRPGRRKGRPNRSREPDHPATYIRFADAQDFCRWLTERHPGTFRLPTEAEWEYACRAGTSTPWFSGRDPDSIDRHAWIQKKAWTGADPVRAYEPNPWGLHDTIGNAYEWCDGEWLPRTGPGPPARIPGTTYRVVRGGNWCSNPIQCRSASRAGFPERFPHPSVGFRPVFTLETER